MKVLVAASGGGHFTAGLAVLRAMPQEWEKAFVGRRYTFEGDKTEPLEIHTIRKLHIPYFLVDSARLQRHFTKHSLPSLLKLPKSLLQARTILQQIKPDVVISFGGYSTVPVVFAASRMGIPIVLHEQVLTAGLANKIASRFANKICLSWKESEKYFPKSHRIITGNPVKEEIQMVEKLTVEVCRTYLVNNLGLSKSEKPLLYITGGSSGSHSINIFIEQILDSLLERYSIIHQTGAAMQYNDFERLEKRRMALPKEKQSHYILQKFFSTEESAYLLKASDITIGRSGIGTVSELLFLQKFAFFIPLVLSRQNEQLKNAKFYQALGLGEYVLQEKLRKDHFLHSINSLLIKKHVQISDEVSMYHELFAKAADTIVRVIKEYDISSKTNTETK